MNNIYNFQNKKIQNLKKYYNKNIQALWKEKKENKLEFEKQKIDLKTYSKVQKKLDKKIKTFEKKVSNLDKKFLKLKTKFENKQSQKEKKNLKKIRKINHRKIQTQLQDQKDLLQINNANANINSNAGIKNNITFLKEKIVLVTSNVKQNAQNFGKKYITNVANFNTIFSNKKRYISQSDLDKIKQKNSTKSFLENDLDDENFANNEKFLDKNSQANIHNITRTNNKKNDKNSDQDNITDLEYSADMFEDITNKAPSFYGISPDLSTIQGYEQEDLQKDSSSYNIKYDQEKFPILGKGKSQANTWETIKRTFSYIKWFKKEFILGLTISILNSICMIAMALLLKNIVDDIVSKNVSSFINITIIYSILIVASLILQNYGTFVIARMAQKIVYKMTDQLIAKLQKLPVPFFDKNQPGNVISVFTEDLSALSNAFDVGFPGIIINSVSIFLTLIATLFMNVYLGIALIVFFIVFLFVVKNVTLRTKKYSRQSQNTAGKLSGYTEEMISSIKVFKTTNNNTNVVKKFDHIVDSYAKIKNKVIMQSDLLDIYTTVFTSLLYAVVAIISGFLAKFANISVGSIVSYLRFSQMIAHPLSELSRKTNIVFFAVASAQRIFSILDADDEKDTGKVQYIKLNDKYFWTNNQSLALVNGNLKFKDVSFKYDKQAKDYTIDNFSFNVSKGQTVALVGPTGSGKTTITNLINRFYEIDEGKITIDNIDIRNIKKHSLRKNITTVLQDSQLFSGTIKDNILYGNKNATLDDAIQAAKQVNIHEYIMSLPNGYDTEVSLENTTLSSGQIQLISIARALIAPSKILILDEATSSVDTNVEKQIQQSIDLLVKSKTTLIIAHRLSTIENADLILFIDQGKIVESGSHKELLAKKGRYYNLYHGIEVLQ